MTTSSPTTVPTGLSPPSSDPLFSSALAVRKIIAPVDVEADAKRLVPRNIPNIKMSNLFLPIFFLLLFDSMAIVMAIFSILIDIRYGQLPVLVVKFGAE
jgi:hypothetical protein